MSYEPVTVREAAQIEVLLFVALAFVGALLIIFWGFQTYQFGRIIRDTPPEPVSGVAMGRTELVGSVHPATKLFDKPFTDGKCVYADFRVREYRESNDDDENDRWETVQHETVSPPFYLDDGTGQMLVEPNDETLYELSGACSTTISVGRRESPPDTVQEFLGGSHRQSQTLGGLLGDALGSVTSRFSGDETREVDAPEAETNAPLDESVRAEIRALDDEERAAIERGERDPPESLAKALAEQGDLAEEQSDKRSEGDSESIPDVEHITRSQLGSVSPTSRKRRYIQTVLPVAEETYIFGGATRKDPDEVAPGEDPVVMSTDPGTEEFIISDKDEFALARRYQLRSTVYIAGGLIAAALILALLAQILITGPVFGIDWATP